MTDQTPFDPYRKWLGVGPDEQPPNHYRLLGIPPFESDPEVIINAADRQMNHLRRFQAGRYARLCEKILNEISAARVCLLDPVRKREYDQRLFREFRAQNRSLPFPVAERLEPEQADHAPGQETSGGPVELTPPGISTGLFPTAQPSASAVLAVYRRRRKSIWRDPAVTILLAVLFLLALTATILILFR